MRLVQVLALVGDLADAVAPPTGAFEDHGRLVLVRDGELVQCADPARDHDHRVGCTDRQCVAHPAHPRGERDVDVGIRLTLVEAREDPDDQTVRGLRASAHGLHHTGEPAADDDRAPLREKSSDLLGRHDRLRRHGILRVARSLADDGYEDRASHRALT